MPVDLLYNGGVGTYVKASEKRTPTWGDRTNDRVRVKAADVPPGLWAKAGTGGFTQMARIEYWMHGGLINTDAIDNSGGVDTSDHEVNLKILLDILVKKGSSRAKRTETRSWRRWRGGCGARSGRQREPGARPDARRMRSAADYDAFVTLVDEMKLGGVIERSIRRSEPGGVAGERSEIAWLPRPLLADLLGYTKMWGYEKSCTAKSPKAKSRARSWTVTSRIACANSAPISRSTRCEGRSSRLRW